MRVARQAARQSVAKRVARYAARQSVGARQSVASVWLDGSTAVASTPAVRSARQSRLGPAAYFWGGLDRLNRLNRTSST
jgi:hypothetical protein